MNTCRSKAETVLREFVKKVQLMRFAQRQYVLSNRMSFQWAEEKRKLESEVDSFISKFDTSKTAIDDWK